MYLRLDRAAGREAAAEQLIPHDGAQAWLGQEQEVLGATTQNPQRRDHACLRRQQQRVADAADLERDDIIRNHSVQVVGCLRALDADEVPRALCGNDLHAH